MHSANLQWALTLTGRYRSSMPHWPFVLCQETWSAVDQLTWHRDQRMRHRRSTPPYMFWFVYTVTHTCTTASRLFTYRQTQRLRHIYKGLITLTHFFTFICTWHFYTSQLNISWYVRCQGRVQENMYREAGEDMYVGDYREGELYKSRLQRGRKSFSMQPHPIALLKQPGQNVSLSQVHNVRPYLGGVATETNFH